VHVCGSQAKRPETFSGSHVNVWFLSSGLRFVYAAGNMIWVSVLLTNFLMTL
jgi:hypothetical protein